MLRELLIELLRDELSPKTREPQREKPANGRQRIVICQRGFVYAGMVTFDGPYLRIENAVNIRRWGTSRGLGELAAKGNQPETKCDPCGAVTVHELAVVAIIDCFDGVSIDATT